MVKNQNLCKSVTSVEKETQTFMMPHTYAIPYALVIPSNLDETPNIVAHEFGHGVGLWDIYHKAAGLPDITGDITSERCPEDWPGSASYYSYQSQLVLVHQLLMYGHGDCIGANADIPRGKVYGIRRNNTLTGHLEGMVDVGLEDINLSPNFD